MQYNITLKGGKFNKGRVDLCHFHNFYSMAKSKLNGWRLINLDSAMLKSTENVSLIHTVKVYRFMEENLVFGSLINNHYK